MFNSKIMEDRKLAKDWRKAHGNAKAKVTRVETQIAERALELIVAHPDADVVLTVENEKSSFKANEMSHVFISHVTTETRLEVIESIEKYLADNHPHQQGSFEFVLDTSGSTPKKK